MCLGQGLIELPPGVEFVRQDGKVILAKDGGVASAAPITLGSFCDRYLETHGNGALEERMPSRRSRPESRSSGRWRASPPRARPNSGTHCTFSSPRSKNCSPTPRPCRPPVDPPPDRHDRLYGARRSELIRIRISDVDFAGGIITVREKKAVAQRADQDHPPCAAFLIAGHHPPQLDHSSSWRPMAVLPVGGGDAEQEAEPHDWASVGRGTSEDAWCQDEDGPQSRGCGD